MSFETKPSDWSVPKLREALIENGITHAVISPNTEVWHASVLPRVEAGECSMEDFIRNFTPGRTWRDALTLAIANHNNRNVTV